MNGYMTVNEILEKQQDNWEKTELPREEFSLIPKGTYKAMLKELKIVATKTEEIKLKWNFQILAPSNTNRYISIFDFLQGEPERLKWTKKNLMTAGCKIDALKDLINIIPSIEGKAFEIYIDIKAYNDKEYNRCYINKAISLDDIYSSNENIDNKANDIFLNSIKPSF